MALRGGKALGTVPGRAAVVLLEDTFQDSSSTIFSASAKELSGFWVHVDHEADL